MNIIPWPGSASGHNELFVDSYGYIVYGCTIGDFHGVMPVDEAIGLKLHGFSESPESLLSAIRDTINLEKPVTLPVVFAHGKNRGRRIVRIEPIRGRSIARVLVYNSNP